MCVCHIQRENFLHKHRARDGTREFPGGPVVKAAWSQRMSCVHKQREMSLGHETLVDQGAPSFPTAQLSGEWSMLQRHLVGKALSPGVAGVTPVPG